MKIQLFWYFVLWFIIGQLVASILYTYHLHSPWGFILGTIAGFGMKINEKFIQRR